MEKKEEEEEAQAGFAMVQQSVDIFRTTLFELREFGLSWVATLTSTRLYAYGATELNEHLPFLE